MKKTISRYWIRSGGSAVAAMATATVAASLAWAQTPDAATPPPAVTPTADEISYELGLTYGTQMHAMGLSGEVDVDAIMRGLRDGMQGKHTTSAGQQQIQAFVHAAQEKLVAKNQLNAQEFLASNAKLTGVVTTASGLEYRVLAAGDKKAPAISMADTVTVQYRGKLLDGSEFDSSYSRNEPTPIPVNGVIKGWQEALMLMKPGAKWQIWVPPALAYGTGFHPKIPGGSLLVFDIEIVRGATPKPAPATPTATPPSH